MNTVENKSAAKLRPIIYWWLWLLNAVLVSAGFLFFLATHYGSYEFFGKACAMALLPLIPVLVLVGGAGSTIFALTKVLIEKRGLNTAAALALLAGPGCAVTSLLVLLGATWSSGHWLNYICAGNAPASASHVRVAGYSTFLREEWLAVFNVGPTDFETFVARTKLVPADRFEFDKILEQSSVRAPRVRQNFPLTNDLRCFKRVFKESEEHERGSVYAAFDPATATAMVLRKYRD